MTTYSCQNGEPTEAANCQNQFCSYNRNEREISSQRMNHIRVKPFPCKLKPRLKWWAESSRPGRDWWRAATWKESWNLGRKWTYKLEESSDLAFSPIYFITCFIATMWGNQTWDERASSWKIESKGYSWRWCATSLGSWQRLWRHISILSLCLHWSPQRRISSDQKLRSSCAMGIGDGTECSPCPGDAWGKWLEAWDYFCCQAGVLLSRRGSIMYVL